MSDTLSRQLPVESDENSMIDDEEMSPFLESIVSSLPGSRGGSRKNCEGC